MKQCINYFQYLWISCLFVLSPNLLAENLNPYKFVSPKPASIMVSNNTNIILRHVSIINEATVSNNFLKVEGSKSGIRAGDLILSDDGKTITLIPHEKSYRV